jgi:sulfite reductase beta subunit-like hemoprotein
MATANPIFEEEPTSAPRPRNFLPRFSDKADITEFVQKLEAFEKGELTSDQFRAYRLLRGVYGQRQENEQMIRIKIPMGRLDPAGLHAIADVADKYSRGYGHVTTRQNIQLHMVKLKDAEAALLHLDTAGLTTRAACGNSVRNVTACEMPGVCCDSAFDVTPYAEGLARYFLRHPLSEGLPRKFKIAFSGSASDCAKTAIHDLGFIARVLDGQRGFKVVCAGGLSTTPQAAITLHDFLPAAELSRVGEAVLRIFNDMGNRNNKARARLKYVLRKLGPEKFLATYAEYRAQVDAEAIAEIKLPPQPETTPRPPVDGDARAPGFLAWKASSVVDQREDGYAAVYVRLFLGDMTSSQMRALARIADTFGDGTVRLTIDQNVLIPFVDKRSLAALYGALKENDLAKLDIHTAKDVTSCPGADTCNLAVTGSRGLAAAIMDRLEKVENLDGLKDTVIKVSGCPNSCGQHHIADIGWHGGAKTIGDKTYPVYQLHLGGGSDFGQAFFGRQVVKVLARRAPEAVVKLLELFEKEKNEGERPAQFFRRVDAKRVVAALGELVTAPPTPEELVDNGEQKGFQVELGEGECAA